MSDAPDRDRRLLALLLGELGEAEREALEDELFRDDALFGRLLELEEEVVEGTIEGTLPVDARIRVTQALPRWEPLRRSKDLASALREASSRDAARRAVAIAVVASRRMALHLRPGLVRGDETYARLLLTDEIDHVELLFDVAHPRHPRFAVVIESPEGEQLGSFPDLPVEWRPEGAVVRVELPAVSLSAGAKIARLDGLAADGAVETIDEYAFEVLRSA